MDNLKPQPFTINISQQGDRRMNQIEALKELAAKVEAEDDYIDFTQFHDNDKNASFRRPLEIDGWSDGLAIEAHEGSQNAAHSLHKAITPKWNWSLSSLGCTYWRNDDEIETEIHIEDSVTPRGRLRLLATIKAKIAELEGE